MVRLRAWILTLALGVISLGTVLAGCAASTECPPDDPSHPACRSDAGPRDAGADAGPDAAPECASNSDCLPGEACNSGICGPCRSRADCDPSEACLSGACGACIASTDCAPGQVCLEGACGACGSDDECADGQACVAGVCGPCATSTDCAGGRICTDGACGPCAFNEDCASGLACVGGVCGDCSSNADCAAGEACVAGVCGSCLSNTDCAAGEACIAGVCGACGSNADCASGEACVAGACGACGSNTDCATGEACISGACGACTGNGDCAAGEACIAGVCGPCASASDCAATEACIAGACGPCRGSADCGTGRVCDGGSCRGGTSPAMHQCPSGISLGGGAWGYYACQGQIWSPPACTTIEYPSSSSTACTPVGRMPLITDGSPAPGGATHVPMYQCPSGISLGGGAWGFYDCQGQITNKSSCTTIEYPSTSSSACTAVGQMTLFATAPAPPPGGRVVQMYQCPGSMSLGGGAWGYYGCQGQIWSVPSCTIIESPTSASFPCTSVGFAVLDP